MSYRSIESSESKRDIRDVTNERISQSLSCKSSVSMNQIVNDMPSNIVALELRADFGYWSLVPWQLHGYQ